MSLQGEILYKWKGDVSDLKKAQKESDKILSDAEKKSTLLGKSMKLIGIAAGVGVAGAVIKMGLLKKAMIGLSPIMQSVFGKSFQNNFRAMGASFGSLTKTIVGSSARIAGSVAAIASVSGTRLSSELVSVWKSLGNKMELFTMATAKKILGIFSTAFKGIGIGLSASIIPILNQEKPKIGAAFGILGASILTTLTPIWVKIKAGFHGLGVGLAGVFAHPAWRGVGRVAENLHMLNEGLLGAFPSLKRLSIGLFGLEAAAFTAKSALSMLGFTGAVQNIEMFTAAFNGILAGFGILVNRIGNFAANTGRKLLDTFRGWTMGAGEFERTVWGLGVALEGYRKRVGETSLSLEDFTQKTMQLSITTGVGMESLHQGVLVMLDLARTTGLTSEQIYELLGRMADFSAVTHTDIMTSVYAIDQAFRGYWRSLSSLGIQMDENTMAAAGFVEGMDSTKQGMTNATAATTKFNFLMHETEFVANKAAEAIGTNLPDAMRYYEASLKNLQSLMGRGMVTIWAKFYYTLGSVVSMFTSLPQPVLSAVTALGAISAVMLVGVGTFLKYAGAVVGLVAAVRLLNIVLTAGIVIAGRTIMPAVGQIIANFLKMEIRVKSLFDVVKLLPKIFMKAILEIVGVVGIGIKAIGAFIKNLWITNPQIFMFTALAAAITGVILLITKQRDILKSNIEEVRKQKEQIDSEINSIDSLKKSFKELDDIQGKIGKEKPDYLLGVAPSINIDKVVKQQEQALNNLINLARKYPAILKSVLAVQPGMQKIAIADKLAEVQDRLKAVREEIQKPAATLGVFENYGVVLTDTTVKLVNHNEKLVALKKEETSLLNEEKKHKIALIALKNSFIDTSSAAKGMDEVYKELEKRSAKLRVVLIKYLEMERKYAKRDLEKAQAAKEAAEAREKSLKELPEGTGKGIFDLFETAERGAKDAYSEFLKYTKILDDANKALYELKGVTEEGFKIKIDIDSTAEEDLNAARAAGDETVAMMQKDLKLQKDILKDLEEYAEGKGKALDIIQTKYENVEEIHTLQYEGVRAMVIKKREDIASKEKAILDKSMENREKSFARETAMLDLTIKLIEMQGNKMAEALSPLEAQRNIKELVKTFEEMDFEIKKRIKHIDPKALKQALMPLKWTADDELRFQEWYKKIAEKMDLNKNPDFAGHQFDYRKAMKAGIFPDPEKVIKGMHWPSEFKFPWHENRFIEQNGKWLDTINNQYVSASEKRKIQSSEEMQFLKALNPAFTIDYLRNIFERKNASMQEINDTKKMWIDFYAEMDMMRAKSPAGKEAIQKKAAFEKDKIDMQQRQYDIDEKKRIGLELYYAWEKDKTEEVNDDIAEIDLGSEIEKAEMRKNVQSILLTDQQKVTGDLEIEYIKDLSNYRDALKKEIISREQYDKAILDRANKLTRDLKLAEYDEKVQPIRDRMDYEERLTEFQGTELQKRVKNIQFSMVREEDAEYQRALKQEGIYADKVNAEENLGNMISAIREKYSKAYDDLLKNDLDLFIDNSEKIGSSWQQMIDGMVFGLQQYVNSVPSMVRAVADIVTDYFTGMGNAIADTFMKMVEKGRITKADLTAIWGGFATEFIRSVVRMGAQALMQWIAKMIFGATVAQTTAQATIAALVEEEAFVWTLVYAYTALAIAKAAAGASGGGGGDAGTMSGGEDMSYAQHGGLVPGEGEGDKVPAMLEPKEYVVKKKVVKQIGVDWFDKLNKGVFTIPAAAIHKLMKRNYKEYKEGGIVEGDMPFMSPARYGSRASVGVSKDDFAKITVVNVFDEMEAQKYFTNKKYGDVILNRAMKQTSKFVKRGRR